MGIALAHFGWTPAVFWSATPHELFAMFEARRAAAEAARTQSAPRP